MANYGPAGLDRRQVLVFNYIYNLPSVSKAVGLNGKVSRVILDDWQIYGITTMSSGSPLTPSYSINNVSAALLDREITGSDTEAPGRAHGRSHALATAIGACTLGSRQVSFSRR